MKKAAQRVACRLRGEIRLSILLALIFFSMPLRAEGGKSQVPLADPYILLDGDKYYAYGTHDGDGIRCYSSDDLRSWRDEGQALNKANTSETQWFWAPEVYHVGDRYIMYYSANEHLYAATATSPKGPFKQVGTYQMNSLLGSEKCIDSSVFFDDNGTAWLFFVRFTDGNCIWQCQLADDYITPVAGTLKKCFAASQSWELKMGRINEGPNVVKYNRRYFLTYSGNDYQSQDYGVGYATCSNLSTGTWTKYASNPILRRREELVGTGHHSIFTDKEGILRIVFHAHNSASTIHSRLMYIGTMQFVGTRLMMTDDPIIRPTLTAHPYNPERIDKTMGFERGAATTVDLNNDGHQDIVAGGFGNEVTNSNASDDDTQRRLTYVSLFSPNSHRWAAPTLKPPFKVADMPSIIPCDLDNDGNMDIVAFEQTGTDPTAEACADDYSRQGIFLGCGNGNFTETTPVFTTPDGRSCPFDMKGPCSADVIDIDNDGRLDIVCAGHQGETSYSAVLHNAGIDDGGIHFIVEPYETEYLLSRAVIQATDLNNDGYQDFVIASMVDGRADQTCFTDIYLNDSLRHGHFIRQAIGERNGQIKRKAGGALQLADFDGDGWTDIFLSGEGDTSSGEKTLRQRIYINQHTPTPSFTVSYSDVATSSYVLKTSVNNSAGVIDWDGDGMYDILMGGTASTGQVSSGHLFLNTAGARAGRLTKTCTIPGATMPSIVFPDWNGDGRKDFLLTGLCTDANYLTGEQKGRTSVLCYNLYPTPSRPQAPVSPTASVQEDGTVLLQWEVPETVLPNCTYELYITDSLGRQLNSTPAFVGGEHDGIRKVNRMGRVGCVRQWTFHPATPGIYHWGVQTVNAAYDGSTFTPGPDFTVTDAVGIQPVTAPQAGSGTDGQQVYSPSGMLQPQPRRGVNIIKNRQGVYKVMRP